MKITRSVTLLKFVALAAAFGLAFNLILPGNSQSNAQAGGKVFELRVYKSTPGNLGNLQARFRNHTLSIFEKHGMTNIGYWAPTDPELADDTLIYLLSHDSREAADASWRAFGQDPEWQAVAEASNANGQILASVERTWLTALDFSPMK
jgi:hypothetical protein